MGWNLRVMSEDAPEVAGDDGEEAVKKTIAGDIATRSVNLRNATGA